MIFPILVALLLGIVYLFGGWESIIENHNLEFYFLKKISISFSLLLFALLWIIIIFMVTYSVFISVRKIRDQRLKTIIIGTFIFLIAFIIRCIFIMIYSKDLIPFSDFAASWELAKGNYNEGNMSYYSLFPAYMNYSFFLNRVIFLFGDSFIVVLYINAICCGMTATFLYLITKEIIENEITCIFVGALYTVYPSNFIYITTATPDFIAVCFNTIGIYLLLKCIKSNSTLATIILALFGGLSLGVGGSFKTYSVVMIIAFAIILIVLIILRKNDKHYNWSKMLTLIVLFTLTLFAYRYVTIALSYSSSVYYDMVLSSKKAIPHYLLIGLNTEGEGQIHLGTLSRQYYQFYLSNGMNYENAKEYAYTLLSDDWHNNQNKIIPNFCKKMIWAWQDDYTPIRYFLNYVGIKPNTLMKGILYYYIESYGAGITQISYLLILTFAFIGSMFRIIKKEISISYEFVTLIVFGFFCMIFIIEGQSRYKCLVMPYVIILSGVGIDAIINKYGLILKKCWRIIINEKGYDNGG